MSVTELDKTDLHVTQFPLLSIRQCLNMLYLCLDFSHYDYKHLLTGLTVLLTLFWANSCPQT